MLYEQQKNTGERNLKQYTPAQREGELKIGYEKAASK